MKAWFSEYRVRCLAERIAPRIMPSVSEAVSAAIRATVAAELPGLLMEELRAEIPEHTPKRSAASRRDRDAMIRSRYTGRNARELAAETGLSIKQVHRIANGIK